MYIAVHGGAGTHSHTLEKEVKHALRLACKEALKDRDTDTTPPRRGPTSTPLDVVGNAIAILEDDPHLNAGYGSNLTLSGTVECDAAIMDGDSSFGSVGAVSGMKNPIKLARAILDHSKIPDPLGRIPPLTLVSEGARSFAAAKHAQGDSLQSVPPESMISLKARNDWMKWKARLEGAVIAPDLIDSSTRLTDIQDTVGAVAFQNRETVAAGVSSGGILLKHPGRLGEAAIFGAGCWAQEFPESGIRIACSLSGAGEHIERSMLAHEIGDSFRLAINKGDIDAHNILYGVLLEKFWVPSRARGVIEPDVGVLLLMAEQIEDSTSVRLWCAFTTNSMAIAYASSDNPKPHVMRVSLWSDAWQLIAIRRRFFVDLRE